MLINAAYVHASARLPRNWGPRRLLPILATDESFPSFLPREVESIKDSYGRKLASRIERLSVNVGKTGINIMSSVVKTSSGNNTLAPLLLLHGFDSSCLEWRYTFPLLEEAGLECWAVDVLGWGFSDTEAITSYDVASKRNHLYQLWRTYIKRPVVLVGPSLGAAVAIDFATNHPEAVDRLILVDASVYTKEKESKTKLPRMMAYAGVYILKSLPLRVYGTLLAFNGFKVLDLPKAMEYVKMGRLHCLYPWWEDATVNFMLSGGYNVRAQITKVKQPSLIIWGQEDNIIDSKDAERLQAELPDAILRQVPDCGHLPHVEKPNVVAKLIMEFVRGN